MAEANEVTDRIVVGAGCDRAALSHLVGGRRALIISDCEGFEREIFTADIASELASSEIVIELHEHKRELFGNEIARGFADTHDATFIRSSYDIARALNTTVPELAAMNLSERVVLIAELRPVSMRWLHLSPRHRIASGAQPELARCEA